MKMNKRLITIICTAMAGTCIHAENKETAKTGWNFGPLPAVSYSSDFGFQYGALCDIYYYGDGSTYPHYMHKFNVEISAYTKGCQNFHADFDSRHLIPGIRFSTSVSYFANKTSPFYGFNGSGSLYIPELDRIIKQSEFAPDGTAFYLMRRDVFRALALFQGKIGSSNWGWAAGATFWNFRTDEAKSRSITQGTPSLFSLYASNGILPEDELSGGSHLELRGGFVYDTRDHENNPSRGTNLEAYLYGSYDFIQKRNHYLKAAVHFKQFHTLVPEKLILGYHLAYQGLLAGSAPFYSLPVIQVLNMKQINTEGLGSVVTMRGTVANRLLGDSYAWANIELRYNFLRFDWIGQHWILALNPFIDSGWIARPYREKEIAAAAENPANKALELFTINDRTYSVSDLLFTGSKDRLHFSGGLGLHVIMNHNFNVNIEVAKVFDSNDGSTGMNIGLNYIF